MSPLRVIALFTIILAACPAAGFADPDAGQFSAQQLANVANQFRTGALARSPKPIYLSLYQEILGNAVSPEPVDDQRAVELGSLFMLGAIPFVLSDSSVAFYNPYCDIFLFATFEADSITKTAQISHTFVGGGDTLATFNGEREKIVGPDDTHFVDEGMAQRVATRFNLLVKSLKTRSPVSLMQSLARIEDHGRLVKRYLLVGYSIARLSPRERGVLQEIADALYSGNTSKLKADKLVPQTSANLSIDNFPEQLRKHYRAVFTIGPASNRLVYLESDDNPTIAASAELLESGDNLTISKLVILDYARGVQKLQEGFKKGTQ